MRQLEQDRQDHVAGARRLGGEPAVALGPLDQLGQACQRIALLQQGLQRLGRHGAALGLGEQQVERDRPRARRLDPFDQLGHQAAAPGPAADRGETRIVDQHEGDRARGRLRRPGVETKIQQLALELLHQAQLAARQIGQRHRKRRQKGHAEGGEVA